MKIEIKNVKIAQFASEETLCYEATVYVDGERAFTASNQGCGGPDMYHSFMNKQKDGHCEKSKALLNKAEDYCKNLPKIPSTFREGETFDNCLEFVIGDLLNEFEIKKQVKCWLRSACVFKDNEIIAFKGKFSPSMKEALVKKYGNDVIILNDLPFDEAYATIKDHI